jgi:hypothetical protein
MPFHLRDYLWKLIFDALGQGAIPGWAVSLAMGVELLGIAMNRTTYRSGPVYFLTLAYCFVWAPWSVDCSRLGFRATRGVVHVPLFAFD